MKTAVILMLASFTLSPDWAWMKVQARLPGVQDPSGETGPDRLDELLTEEQQQSCGIAKLTRDERKNIAVILDSLLSEISTLKRLRDIDLEDEEDARAIGWRRGREELEYQGYKKLQAAVVRANNSDYFVVRKTFGTYATEDIPLTFPSLTFQEGFYWCNEAAFGGISSIIIRGREYRFLFADWETL